MAMLALVRRELELVDSTQLFDTSMADWARRSFTTADFCRIGGGIPYGYVKRGFLNMAIDIVS